MMTKGADNFNNFARLTEKQTNDSFRHGLSAELTALRRLPVQRMQLFARRSVSSALWRADCNARRRFGIQFHN